MRPVYPGKPRRRKDMSSGASARRGLIRQGDLLLVPVEEIPADARGLPSGRLVLAEGEATGHAHVVDDVRASLHSVRGAGSWFGNGTWFLSVAEGVPVLLVHEEHDPLSVLPGVYEVRRQREYVPRGVSRWVSD
jgi:hypothetical protein